MLVIALSAERISSPYVIIPLSIAPEWVEFLAPESLPDAWDALAPGRASQHLGDAWAKELRSAALAVPSVIIAQEVSYLLNPLHPDVAKITQGEPEVFTFDRRLKPTKTRHGAKS